MSAYDQLGRFNDVDYSDAEELFSYIYKKLNSLNLAYLHVVERFPGTELSENDNKMIERLRDKFSGCYIANGDYDKDKAEHAIASEYADAVAFGRPFIANPDLPERFRLDAELNEPDQDTFYGGGAEGYIDYPALATD